MSHTNQQKGMLLARLLQKAMIFKNQNHSTTLPKSSQAKSANINQKSVKNLNRDISSDSIQQSFFTAKDDLNQMLKFIYVELFGQQKYNKDLQRYQQIEMYPQKFKEAEDFNKEGKLMENIIFQIRQMKKKLKEGDKQIKKLKTIKNEIQIREKSSLQRVKINPESLIAIQNQKISILQAIKSYQQKQQQLTQQIQMKNAQIVRINHLNQMKIIKIQQLEQALHKKQLQADSSAFTRIQKNFNIPEQSISPQFKHKIQNLSTQQFTLNIKEEQKPLKIKIVNSVSTELKNQNSVENCLSQNNIHNYQQKISLLKQELVHSKKIIHAYQKQTQCHQTQIQKYQQFISDLSNQIQICQQKLCSDKKELINKKVQTQNFNFSLQNSSLQQAKNLQNNFYCPQTPNFRQTSLGGFVQVDSEFQESRNVSRKNTFNNHDISKIQKKQVFSDKQSITLSQFSQTEQLRDIRNLTKELSQAYDKIISLTYEVNNLKIQNKNINNKNFSNAFAKKDAIKDSQNASKRLVKQK